jgi:hypothetical protein
MATILPAYLVAYNLYLNVRIETDLGPDKTDSMASQLGTTSVSFRTFLAVCFLFTVIPQVTRLASGCSIEAGFRLFVCENWSKILLVQARDFRSRVEFNDPAAPITLPRRWFCQAILRPSESGKSWGLGLDCFCFGINGAMPARQRLGKT